MSATPPDASPPAPASSDQGGPPLPVPDDLLRMPDTWRRVWGVLANPDNLHLSVARKAELAGVDRTTWWRTVNNPEFATASDRALRAAIGAEATTQIVLTAVAAALLPGGHADRWKLLEMLGHYQPGVAAARERAKGDRGGPGSAASVGDDELLKIAGELGIKPPPGVLRRLAAKEGG